jgi:hypothetical protein
VLFHDPCPDGIEIDVGKAIDQGLAIIYDNTLEPFGPEELFACPHFLHKYK